MPAHNMPQVETIARQLLLTFGWHHDPTIKGILLIGSAAAGASDAASDVDLVVIAKPTPSAGLRAQTYKDAGSNKAIIGFFRSDSPILRSNIIAIDKVWIEGLQFDICFCHDSDVHVYDHQNFVILKSCASLEQLRPVRRQRNVPKPELETRLSYSFRVMLVHRDRYARWCERRRWLCTDVSAFLQAARDMILVLNGYVLYNSANPHFWTVMQDVPIKVHGLSESLADIKQLDDRVASVRKLHLMDELIHDLEQLCSSKGVQLRVYDIEAPCD